MDQIKIGKFISESRKSVKLTQEQLAEKLGISKNAVCKWERGLNLPDTSLMMELCSILNISLNELFAGEHLKEEQIETSADDMLDILKLNDMTKKDFKKFLRKKNKVFKNNYIYEIILILLFIIVTVPNIILTVQNRLPNRILLLSVLLTLLMGLPIMIIDIQNDIEIKRMYQTCIQEKKIPTYKDKSKKLKIILVSSIVLIFINGCFVIPNRLQKDDFKEIENTLTITTNQGNLIETQYEKLGEFKLKIPTEFKIMKDEMIHIKYPTGNPPSLVYTNERGTINIAISMNDVTMKNTEIEEYVKMMESTYKKYTKDVKINFWERKGHKIGEMEFVTQASDTEIYNHLIAFSINNQLRLVNFNCTKEFINEWQEVIAFIINSIIFE